MLTPALRVRAGKVDMHPEATRKEQDTALADLVRTALEEELSGELGERITRTVRRLVRAEVAAVLAARSVE